MTTAVDATGDHPAVPSGTPIVAALADHALALRRRGLTTAETHAGARAILDWFGATIAGSGLPPAQLLAAAVLEPGAARLVPFGAAASVRTAALVNATASHTVEMDDIYRNGIYHPGSPTVGAALALAEQRNCSGADLIRAVAIGYEIGDRVAETVNPTHYRFWHTTGTIGTIGAAVAAGDLLGLDETRLAHAIATATTMAAGLQQAFRSDAMSKPLHAGHAAEAGLLAALAAGKGFTGALDVLDGAAGFGTAMAGTPDWDATLRDPDRPLGICTPTVKTHACCGHTFAAVDAALELRTAGVRAEQVESIVVRTYTTATKVAGVTDPRTEFEAKFSTAYCVAAALQLGSVRLRAFEPDALGNAELRALARRVTLVADDAMEADFPGKRRAVVTATQRDGSVSSAERHTRKGDPDDPLSDDEMSEKFVDLATPVIGAVAADRLAAALWNLADLAQVRDLPYPEGTSR